MKKVTIYSKENCGACLSAKLFMNAQKIEFEEVRVDQDEEAYEYVLGQGVNSLPFIEIGDVKIAGFVPGKILAAVK